MLKALLRWFAKMRRRFFGRFGSNVAVAPTPTPPPTPGAAALIFNIAANSQYVTIVVF